MDNLSLAPFPVSYAPHTAHSLGRGGALETGAVLLELAPTAYFPGNGFDIQGFAGGYREMQDHAQP